MTVREAVRRISGALHPEPQVREKAGRSVPWTKFTFVLFHLLFVAWWVVGHPNPLGALLVWSFLQFGVNAGFHRYFAHRSFKTHPWFEFVLAGLGCLAVQDGPVWWVSEHRHHHRSADTQHDFHSPRDGFWHSHMGWLLRDDIDDSVKWDLIPDLRSPIPLWVDRHQRAIRLAYAAALALIFGWTGVLTYWVVPVVWCWHTSLATNSLCHAFGSHRAECPPKGSCAARNNALVALLNLGEGWHNNHHAHPTYAHHGFHRWYELDVVYVVLLVLEKLGIIWDVKRRPKRRERSGAEPVGLNAA
ncbi:MAG TPA: acyl-CoA desaturase [Gemmatimonadales bacterium]